MALATRRPGRILCPVVRLGLRTYFVAAQTEMALWARLEPPSFREHLCSTKVAG